MIQSGRHLCPNLTTIIPSPFSSTYAFHLAYISSLTYQPTFKLATFEETTITTNLPHPLAKVICTYGTLCDLSHTINLIQFHSIEAVDIHGNTVLYIQQLRAIATPLPPQVRIMAANYASGFNMLHGYDTGPPPPTNRLPSFPTAPPVFQPFSSFPGFEIPTQPMFAAPPGFAAAPFPSFPLYPGFGFSGYGQPQPVMQPNIPPGYPPNIHLRNHTGGVGLPPGYDYAFPTEHCKIHVFKTGATPPWQRTMNSLDPATHVKLFVPCNVRRSAPLRSRSPSPFPMLISPFYDSKLTNPQTTVKELMQNLGCTNPDAKKNKLYEVQEAGGGRWVRGLSIMGDNKDKVKKLISELGWDKTRTGGPGERPVVWLYLTKD